MPGQGGAYAQANVVSIRTRSFDRVMRDVHGRAYCDWYVSIRTRSFDRVMRHNQQNHRCAMQFQSAPGLSTG